jgi:hypothetical protein
MRPATRLAQKLRRSFSSLITDEAADLLVEQEEIIDKLKGELRRKYNLPPLNKGSGS